MVLGAISWIWLGLRPSGRTHAWLLLGAFMALAGALGLDAQRMAHYASWFAVPLVAAALGELSTRYFKGGPVVPVLIAVLLGQPVLLGLLGAIPGWDKPPTKGERAVDGCLETSAMRALTRLPTGLVLGEIDLGPRILAQSRHSIVAAPYHRMSWGILAANHALAAPPGEDERAVRALKADYVVTCPARVGLINHVGLGPRSLQMRLDHGQAPAWLEPRSRPGEALQIYRVRPAVAP
jgi:hypothetical protein